MDKLFVFESFIQVSSDFLKPCCPNVSMTESGLLQKAEMIGDIFAAFKGNFSSDCTRVYELLFFKKTQLSNLTVAIFVCFFKP